MDLEAERRPPSAEGPTPAAARGPEGITFPAVAIGMVLLVVLSWGLPHWSLAKNLPMGMGGYLPLEAFILVLALALFNRFRGAFFLVGGLAAVALFIPSWSRAAFALDNASVKMLPAFPAWLHRALVAPLAGAERTPSTAGLAVAAGVLAALAAGAAAGRLLAAALPALRRRLNWRELALVFILLSVGSYTCKGVVWLFGALVAPYQGDTQEKNFKERFLHPIPPEQDPENRAGVPSFLVPFDPYQYKDGSEEFKAEEEALKQFVKGYRKRAPDPLDASITAEKRAEDRQRQWRTFLGRWKRPLRWWLPLLALILLVQVFLAALLNRQWCDHEKLMFPHAQVVRSLLEGEDLPERGRRLLSSRMLWIGAGISMVLFTFQGLNAYYPHVLAPNLNKISLATFISERPWKAMDKHLCLEPFMVAISYLLTSEISLSVWVFGVINQGLRVFVASAGLPSDQAWAIHGEVPGSDALYTGAALAFVAWLAWSGRRHIWYVLRRGLGLAAADCTERSEPLSYPVAFWGFWLALAGILLWCVLAGIKLWVMAVILVLYLVLVVVISRVVGEAGLLIAGMWWPYFPHWTFAHLFGFGRGASLGTMVPYKASWLSGAEVKSALVPVTVRPFAIFSFLWPSFLYHTQMVPFTLAAFKLTEGEPRRRRLLVWLMAAALVLGTAIFLRQTLAYTFEYGTQSTEFNGFRLDGRVFNNVLCRDVILKDKMWRPDAFRTVMMGAGAAVMSGLVVLRNVFYWWPLHPIGMVVQEIPATWGLWFSFLVGWLLKRAALSYGGGEFSQRLNRFFYGLLIGQFLMAAFWNLVAICGTGWNNATVLPWFTY